MLTQCPTCNSTRFGPVFDKHDRCVDCDHIFQNPPDVNIAYDKDYIDTRYGTYTTTAAMSRLRLGLVMSFGGYGKWLDVGYGQGDFVKAAIEAGVDAYGNDVHGQDYGVRDVPLCSDEQWDAVTFFDSVEHFPDLEPAKHVIKRAKLVVISVPKRPDSFPADLTWRHYRPGEHLHYFSPESIRRLVGKPQLFETNIEDTIRKQPWGQNITTCVFGTCS